MIDNYTEVLILSVALTEDTVTNSLIQTLLDKNSLQVGKLLYSLVERNILVSQSKGRWTSYEVNRDFIKIEKSRSKSQEEKQMRILEFCKTPRTLLEIAKELNLSDRYYMKRNYIDPLLERGSLCTQQKSKTAPTQKYMATEAANK